MSELANYTTEALTPDRLVVNASQILTEKHTAVAAIARGALVGLASSGADDGKVKLSLAAAEDGSEVPYGIIAEGTADANGEVLVYVRGDFSEAAVTFGTGHTAAALRASLRAKGIALIPSMGV